MFLSTEEIRICLTRKVFAFGVDPAVAFPTLHHLALVVVIIIAFVAERTKISCKQDVIFSRSSGATHTLRARWLLPRVLREQLSDNPHQ